MSKFVQGLGFDLPNALTGYAELFANLFQRVMVTHSDTEAHS